MASAWMPGAIGRTILERPIGAENGRYAAFADMADAYVAATLEAISEIDVAARRAGSDAAVARQMADIRARLDGLDELIVTLRELQASSGAACSRPSDGTGAAIDGRPA